MSDQITQALSDFAAENPAIPRDTQIVAALSALDWMAVGIAGAQETVAQITRDMVLVEEGAGRAHLFGSPVKVPVRAAALSNGATSHALDYDDTHFAHIGHPSVAVFPAALAIAERQGLSVVETLEAALIGMEVSIRLGLWLGRGHYQAGFHMTATAGAFGAAVAAGKLLGFDPSQMAQVIGLTATRASGLKAQFGTMGKPYNAGLAAANGVETALLVNAGFDANPSALQGTHGFAALYAAEGNTEDALGGLGHSWLFEDVSHKYHACCHGLHAALEAARDLDLAAREIAQLEVQTHSRWMTVCNHPSPSTGLGAKFSYRTVMAMHALGFDTGRLDSFTDKIAQDPRVVRLRDQVVVAENADLSETEAVVKLLRRDGQRFERSHDLITPTSLAARQDRVQRKAEALIGPARVAAIQTLLKEGGGAADLGALMVDPV